MASTRTRGNKKENQAVKELRAAGYNVERAMPEIRWVPPWPGHPLYGKAFRIPISTRHDLYGIGDALAVKLRETRLIQVTIDTPKFHGGTASVRRAKMKAAAGSMPLSWMLEVWRWIPRRSWWKQRAVRDAAGRITDWDDLERPPPRK